MLLTDLGTRIKHCALILLLVNAQFGIAITAKNVAHLSAS